MLTLGQKFTYRLVCRLPRPGVYYDVKDLVSRFTPAEDKHVFLDFTAVGIQGGDVLVCELHILSFVSLQIGSPKINLKNNLISSSHCQSVLIFQL